MSGREEVTVPRVRAGGKEERIWLRRKRLPRKSPRRRRSSSEFPKQPNLKGCAVAAHPFFAARAQRLPRLGEEPHAADGGADDADAGPDGVGGADRQGARGARQEEHAGRDGRGGEERGQRTAEAVGEFEGERPGDFAAPRQQQPSPSHGPIVRVLHEGPAAEYTFRAMPPLNRRAWLAAASSAAVLPALAAPPQAQSAPAGRAARRLRIHQSVARWCYQKIPLDDLCRAGAAMGLVGIDLLGPEDWETPRRYGLICTMGYAGANDIYNGLNRPENLPAIESAFRQNLPLAARA